MALSPGQEVLAILRGRNPNPTKAELLAGLRARRWAAKAEKQAREEAESLAWQQWLEEKAPTAAELARQRREDDVYRIYGASDGPAVFEGIMDEARMGYSLGLPAYPSARSVVTLEMVEAKIINMVVDVEPDWDVVSMIDAHRNGCTALDDKRMDIVIQKESGPAFQELSQVMWDPRHEKGPRERDWIRGQQKRAKGNNHRNGR